MAGDDAFQHRLVRHHDQRFNRAGIDLVTGEQAGMQAPQNIGGAGHGILWPLYLHPVAPGGDVDAQPVLYLHQIGIELAKQRPQNGGFLELDLRPCPAIARGGTLALRLRQICGHLTSAVSFSGHEGAGRSFRIRSF